MLDYSKLPEALRRGTRLYIVHGVEPGDFLSAVIRNDLKEACARADSTNAPLLHAIVMWFYWEAPSPCWGSPEKMQAWMELRRQMDGTRKEDTTHGTD